MSKAETKIFGEMRQELEVRRNTLLQEKKQLSQATARIAEIDDQLAVIDAETVEYDAAIQKAKDSAK